MTEGKHTDNNRKNKVISIDEIRGKKPQSFLFNFLEIPVETRSGNLKTDKAGEPVTKRVGIPIMDIYEELLSRIGRDRINRFSDTPFIQSGSNVVFLRSVHSFFSWIAGEGVTPVFINSPGCVTKSEFFELFKILPCEYKGFSELPHYPSMKSIFYTKVFDQKQDTSQFSKLISMLNPATECDRSLIKAMFCTPFWAGRMGAKPAFFIEGPEEDEAGGRGIGKTSLLDAVAALSGGFIDCNISSSIESIKQRILAENNPARVIRFDNVKSSCLSNSGIESIITSKLISGHRMYVGETSVDNHFTYIFSINDNNLSTDMAQRAVRITLKRASRSKDWVANLFDFIDTHRGEIISDIMGLLKKESRCADTLIRFSDWQAHVLSKIDPREELAEHIEKTQAEVDGDVSKGDDLEDFFSTKISEYWHDSGTSFNTEGDTSRFAYMIRTSVAASWYIEFSRFRGLSTRQATSAIERLPKKQLSNKRLKTDGGNLYWYMRPPGEEKPENTYIVGTLKPTKLKSHNFRRGLTLEKVIEFGVEKKLRGLDT